MDAGDEELFCHLMAKATIMLEDAAGRAAEGQAPQISQDRMIELAGRLEATAQDVSALSGAATVIASGNVNQDD